MKIVNYLDVPLNLENSTYHPYRKDNNQIKYINTESNHPASIIKQPQSPLNPNFHHYPHQEKSSATLLLHTKKL